MKQYVKLEKGTSERLIVDRLESLINEGYHIKQVVQLSKTSYLLIVEKE